MEIVFDIVIIVVSSALLAWLGSVCRQPIIIAYVLAGMLAGPWGLSLVSDVGVIEGLSHIGITLLLFLAGLVLHPERLLRLFRKTCIVTGGNCILSAGLTLLLLRALGYTWTESVLAGIALMFTSTILVVRLLPSTTLHQQYMGSFCIAILIAEDILAVLTLMFLKGSMQGDIAMQFLLLAGKGILLVGVLVVFEQYVLRAMMRQSDQYHEVLYMLTMAWCLGVSALAHSLGLSYEIGAFIAGVVLARNPISRFLSEKLVPLQDFFLMFFFFVLGARFDFLIAKAIWLPALLVTALLVAAKPFIFRFSFRLVGEKPDFAREAGLRLGQCSEFGLIIAVAASTNLYISGEVSQLIQLTVILSIMVSSYLVVFLYPTPIGTKSGLKRD